MIFEDETLLEFLGFYLFIYIFVRKWYGQTLPGFWKWLHGILQERAGFFSAQDFLPSHLCFWGFYFFLLSVDVCVSVYSSEELKLKLMIVDFAFWLLMQIVICYFRRRLIWSLNHFPDAKSCILDEREIITHYFIDGVFLWLFSFLFIIQLVWGCGFIRSLDWWTVHEAPIKL